MTNFTKTSNAKSSLIFTLIAATAIACMYWSCTNQAQALQAPPNLSEAPIFKLPDTCTVTDYDRLGRATHISCVLNASDQDILLSNQAEIDTANEAGYQNGYDDGAQMAYLIVAKECRSDVRASDVLKMCEKMQKSISEMH